MVHDAECQFNDGANEKDLEQSKNVWAWKAAAIKSAQNIKISIKYCYYWEKRKSKKSSIYQEYFQIKL